MGLLGSAIGVAAAIATIHNIDSLISLLSSLQGHELLNPVFYGKHLPNEISGEALAFVMLVTASISLLAGLIPALKACWLRPSDLLRKEG